MTSKPGIERHHIPSLPISKVVRAGDFIFTSALGDHYFDPAEVKFDDKGNVVDDGSGVAPRSMEEETRSVIQAISAALEEAGAELDDIVDMTAWLKDPRDFVALNNVCREYFSEHPPVRSVFQVGFMFDCRVEIKVTAYKPLESQLVV